MSSALPNLALDGQSKSGVMMGLSACLAGLCTLVVGARVYTRAIMLKNAGMDDVMIVVTQIIALALNAATILEAHYGVGRHTWVATAEQGKLQLISLFCAIQLYIWALCLVKVSLLLQYRRIFIALWLRRVSILIMAFAVIWNMAQSVLVSLACVPMGSIRPAMEAHCLPSLPIWYLAAGFNITTDFIVCLLPIPLINSLQLPTRQKILLCMVFGLGLFACVISIIRATKLRSVITGGDPSWYGFDAAIWSMVEVNIAILCSCLPTIRYVVAAVFPCLGLRTERSRTGGRISGSGSKGSKVPQSSSFAMRSSRKSNASGMLGFMGSTKTIGGSTMTGGTGRFDRSQRDAAEDLEATRWGIDYEKGGTYHSNHISAWVSTPPEVPAPTSPRSKRRSTDDESQKQLMEPRESDRDLGIMVTRTTRVEEGRTPAPPRAFVAGRAL